MKRFFFLAVLLSFALTGCEWKERQNTTFQRQVITRKYGPSNVAAVPATNFDYIIRAQDGSIWFVRMGGPKGEGYVDTEIKLFSSQ